MRWSVELHPAIDVSACVRMAQEAERADFDGVWVGDSQLLWRDVFVVLTAIALQTKRVKLGPGVTNLVTRHPSVVASALGAMMEFAPGRIRCGLGLGDSALETIGIRPQRLADMRMGVGLLRRLWSRQSEADTELSYQMLWGEPQHVPVYIGASGPRILSMAGEIADGVIAYVGIAKNKVDAALRCVAAGAREAGRDADSLDIILWVPCSVHEYGMIARRFVKPHVARALTHANPAKLTKQEERVAVDLREAYAYGEHMSPGSSHADIVPDSLVHKYAVAGTPSDCIKQFKGLAGLGVQHIGIIPMGIDRETILKDFVRLVLPHI